MKLVFDIKWNSSPAANGSVTDVTRGSLEVTFGDEVVWPAFEWTWVDFLEHLARVWPLLQWQPWPLDLSPASPNAFANLAEHKLHQMTGPAFDAAETEVWSFTEAHDLAHALGGIGLPSLWLVPVGAVVHVATERCSERVSRAESIDVLEAFLTEICSRLMHVEHPRATAASEAWNQRSKVDLVEAIALYTGLAVDQLKKLAGSASVTDWFDLKSCFLETELVAVARATKGRVSDFDLRKIRERVRRIAANQNSALAELTRKAECLDLAGKPWEQGFELAAWLRAELGSNIDSPIDPSAVLSSWGVAVDAVQLQTKQIDAVACWGSRYGPVVVINERGTHTRAAPGRRATLAHEICHLLIDRHAALPLVEAAGGHIATDLEARARAFSAEFLAPKAGVSTRWSASSGELENRLRSVCRHYGVSKQLAAWQLLNSGLPLVAKELDFLDRSAAGLA